MFVNLTAIRAQLFQIVSMVIATDPKIFPIGIAWIAYPRGDGRLHVGGGEQQ